MVRSNTGSDGERQGEPSRRRLFALTGSTALAALGAAGCGSGGSSAKGGGKSSASGSSSGSDPGPGAEGRVIAPPATGVLAANVNQNLDRINFGESAAVSGTWIRGFYVMSDAGHGNPATQPGLAKLLRAAARGYGTVLGLKFQYANEPIPVPGSPAMRTALARLGRVLAATMGKVDILTIGNEPFFETRGTDRNTSRINTFYETLALHTARYRQQHFPSGCRTKIYMGALTGLDKPADRTAQTRRWMTFTARTRSIAGVDIHPHVADPSDAQKYVDYVLPWLRPDQRFLATEFSLVLLWKAHLSDSVDPHFAAVNGLRRGTPVWQVIRDATRQPFGEKKWNDFLLSCSWYAANRNFLTEQMRRFRSTGRLAVAGYGITQDEAAARDFGPNSHPWVINSLFCPYTCMPEPSGLPGRNTTWCGQFRSAQHR
ncbi:hypothetical protein AB0436_19920 [Streptomyces sp. NPDC051322]|uniref:hypothetical protein n=1 Tax=Streptomyces sp. NPDC051322 TaxID=3154645 RepID=UPI00344EF5F4